MNILRHIYGCIRWRGMYVIADTADDSVTLSKRLYRHMEKSCGGRLDTVYAFSVGGEYAFCCNPRENGWLQQDCTAPLPHIQYNAEHRCIGFHAECPTVNRIAYDYGLPLGRVKLSVRPGRQGNIRYYRLCR